MSPIAPDDSRLAEADLVPDTHAPPPPWRSSLRAFSSHSTERDPAAAMTLRTHPPRRSRGPFAREEATAVQASSTASLDGDSMTSHRPGRRPTGWARPARDAVFMVGLRGRIPRAAPPGPAGTRRQAFSPCYANEGTGRGDWIRTSDLLLPKQMRYQAALHPEARSLAHHHGPPKRTSGELFPRDAVLTVAVERPSTPLPPGTLP